MTGGGSVSLPYGTGTLFTASKSPSNSTVHAQVSGADCTLSFAVIAPSGITFSFDQDVPLGTPGPPNNQIGAKAEFTLTVTPTTVSFYYADFQENIPLNEWTWPDDTPGSYGPRYESWEGGVTYANQCTDTSNSFLAPIGRIYNGSNYVDFSYNISVPEEYKNENNQWVSWYPNETHDRKYTGTNQKAQVVVHGDNTDHGNWQGPWQ